MTISLPQPESCGPRERGATNTRGFHSLRSGRRRRGPSVLSCTTRGLSCPVACAPGGGLLPRLFTLTPSLATGGGMFSVTLSVTTGLRRPSPRVVRGALPYGVRTFLSRAAPCDVSGSGHRSVIANVPASTGLAKSFPPQGKAEDGNHGHGNQELSQDAEKRAEDGSPTRGGRGADLLSRDN